jgi:hypothetical protein
VSTTIIRAADPDRLARRQPGRDRDLPVRPGDSPDLDLQVDVLAVVEQALTAGAAPTVAAEDLVEGLLDGEVLLEQQALRRALAQRSKHLLHLLDGLKTDTNPLDAAEADALQVLAQAGDLPARLADLHVDAASDILARAAEVALLPGEALLETRELVAETQERLARIVDLGDLRRQPTAQPVAH